MREHWQLNVDLFGSDSLFADVEVLTIAHDLLTSFGLSAEKFEIRISDRGLINRYLESLGITEEEANRLIRLIDRSGKVEQEEFEEGVKLILGDNADALLSFVRAASIPEIEALLPESDEIQMKLARLNEIFNILKTTGITNIVFDPSLVRGFDYYTGIVFEVFDTHPDNKRSLFGGGRYDNLLEIFGEEQIPAVGFGMGDVTLRDVLETYDLLPAYESPADLYLCVVSDDVLEHAYSVAQRLREQDIRVAVELAGRAVGTQIKDADSSGIPYVICIGEDEVQSEEYTLKELASGTESTGTVDEIVKIIRGEK